MKLNPDHALVVLSGGQDSTTCLYWALKNFKHVSAVTFDYGQRHRIELAAANKIAKLAGISEYHETINVQGMMQSSSPLTSDTPLDKYENFSEMEAEVGNKVEKTFVPMRNTLFLTIAANRAVALGIANVVTGICGQDNANYPDCTEPFRASLQMAFNRSLGLMTQGSTSFLEIQAPLMFMSKAQTVELAKTLPGCMHALGYSHTSYDGKFPPTDNNHSNLLRAQGFLEADTPDPLVIRAWCEGLMNLPASRNYDRVAKEVHGVYEELFDNQRKYMNV